MKQIVFIIIWMELNLINATPTQKPAMLFTYKVA